MQNSCRMWIFFNLKKEEKKEKQSSHRSRKIKEFHDFSLTVSWFSMTVSVSNFAFVSFYRNTETVRKRRLTELMRNVLIVGKIKVHFEGSGKPQIENIVELER